MNKPVELSITQWCKLLDKLKQDYPASIFLIREKMKTKLGFTIREYKDWDKSCQKYRKNCIMLDFYSEKKRTFFLVKYSEYFS